MLLPSLCSRIAVVVVATVAVGGCGGNGQGARSRDAPVVADSADAAHNEADFVFVQELMLHNTTTSEMAAAVLAPNAPTGAAAREIAREVNAEAERENARLKEVLATWHVSAESAAVPLLTAPGSAPSEPGPVASVGQTTLVSAPAEVSAEFERLWSEALVRHHERAIAAAQQHVADGINAEVLDLARAVMANRERDIAAIAAADLGARGDASSSEVTATS